MSYHGTGGLRDIIAGMKPTATAPAQRISTPPGAIVTGVTTTPAQMEPGPSKLVRWGIPLAVLGVVGFFVWRKRKAAPKKNPARKKRRGPQLMPGAKAMTAEELRYYAPVSLSRRWLAVLPSGKEKVFKASSEREALKKAETLNAVDLMEYDPPPGWD